MIPNNKSNLKNEIEEIVKLYKQKKLQEALNLSNKLITTNNNVPFLFNLNGLINLGLENWKNALLAFKKSLEYSNI